MTALGVRSHAKALCRLRLKADYARELAAVLFNIRCCKVPIRNRTVANMGSEIDVIRAWVPTNSIEQTWNIFNSLMQPFDSGQGTNSASHGNA